MKKSQQRWFDLPSILLLVIATLIVASRLVVTKWVPELHIVANLTRLGLFFGVVIGYSKFKKVGVTFLSLGYGFFFLLWQIFSTTTPYLENEERILEMSVRIVDIFSTVMVQKPVEDHLLVLVLMGLLYWSVALYGGFVLTRYQHGLAALLPVTLVILGVQYSDNKLETPLWMLGFYFFFAFLLLARLDYLNNYEKWKEKNFFIIPDVKIDLHLFSVAAISVLLLFTWNLPSSDAEWRTISRWWDKTTYRFTNARRNIDNIFSSLDNPREARGRVMYGSSLALGERSFQGTDAIAVVDVPDEDELENPPPRYYWRVRSYDTYIDGTWTSADGSISELLSAQTPLLLPIDPESETAKFTFTNKSDLTTNLLTPHQSFWADINTYTTYVPLPNDTRDLNLLRATEQLHEDDVYSILAAPLAPTVSELRAAGTEYPEWVTARYLQIPENFPREIRTLAQDLARGRTTTYDKARVITTYLRTEIEYKDTIPPPPADRDPIEWFLFTWQEGYCNYYASAEVLMLRSLGIPARMVVGFSEGQKVEDGNYAIIQKNAHAWPEVYFPEIGWVEFEPTGNQTRLIRPLGEIEAEEVDGVLLSGLEDDEEFFEIEPIPTPEVDLHETPENLEEEIAQRERPALLFWGMIALASIALFFGIRHLDRNQVFLSRGLRRVVNIYERRRLSAPQWLIRWLAWLEASAIERAFNSINRSLRWLDADAPSHLTPRERAQALIEILPEESEAITQLLNEHERSLFTPSNGDVEKAQVASSQITRATLKQRTQKRSKKTE